MNAIVFVTVRTASKRLPKKALLRIGNKPLIKILIDRLRTSKHIKKIVVCTTEHKSDNKLAEFLKNEHVTVFRGSSLDIVNRLYSAAKKYKVTKFIVVEGDDLFCDLLLIENTWKKISETKYDFLTWEKVPFGVSPLGIRTSKLCKLVKTKSIKNTETGWGKIIKDSNIFNLETLRPSLKKLMRPEIRLTIDYKEDFQLATKILEKLPKQFSLIDIIKILDNNPDWLKINENAKKRYKQNFENKMAKIAVKKKVRHK